MDFKELWALHRLLLWAAPAGFAWQASRGPISTHPRDNGRSYDFQYQQALPFIG